MNDRLAAALADRYRLEREVGRGGMATVYLAEDLKHHRNVAIKVLREDLAASLGASRFLREIEIAAQLQHPNILPLLDSGEADGFLYYVMPFVPGQSLRERIEREGELPVHEAVRLLREVVDALAHAHAHGVVHRDIKPDNVMLSGRHALVTDFGVAKAVSEATGRNTITTLGVAVGTPTYMSPEQAAADPHIDHRSDIYAAGVMAYELIAGRPPFTGATPQQVLAAHVTEAPDPISKRRPGISPPLEHAIMRCLAKRPADRWQTADELLAHLEQLATPSGGITPTDTHPVMRPAPSHWRIPLAAAAVIVLIALGSVLGHAFSRGGPAMTLGQSTQITADAGLEILPAISPDGKFVAYAAGTSARMRVYVRPVAGGRTIALTDDSTAIETQPRWAPDGSTILFLSGGAVMTAPALGGATRPLIPPADRAAIRSAAWSPDGHDVAFVRGDSLYDFTIAGGSIRPVAHGDQLHSCAWSPTGDWIACVSGNYEFLKLGRDFGNIAGSSIVMIPARGGTPVAATDSSGVHQSPVWAPDGRSIFYVSNAAGPRDIYQLPLTRRGRADGTPVRLTTGLNAMSVTISADGLRLAYAVYTAKANIWSLPIPTTPPASISTATAVTSGSQVIEGFRVSLDRRWLVYDSNLHGNADIYRLSIGGGEPERITTAPGDEFQPALSPDGTEVAYHTIAGPVRQIFVLPLNGGSPQRVAATETEQRVADWAPDGTALTWYDRIHSLAWTAQRDPDRRWQAPVMRSAGLLWPRWSPDGHALIGNLADGRIVTVAIPSGTTDTIYSPRPGSSDPHAEWPAWGPDGHSVWFKSHDDEGTATLWSLAGRGGEPRPLVRFDDPMRPSYRVEWGTDGRRIFLALNDRQSDVWVAEVNPR